MEKAKCSEPVCERRAEVFISRKDKNKVEHLYCSVFCAQQDSSRRDGHTKYDTMAKSSFVEHLETSPDISSLGSTIKPEPERKPEPLNLQQMQQFGIIEIKNDTRNLHGPGENETSKRSEPETESEAQVLSQHHSTALSPISDAEQSRQESLIESSIRSTYELSKNVMQAVKVSTKIDPALVNAACNSVKQMHSLMKLRLEIHREMKKK